MSTSLIPPITKKRACKLRNRQLNLLEQMPQPEKLKSQMFSVNAEDYREAEKQCFDRETEIMTRSGWVKMEDMTYDHEVSNWYIDGTITFEKPSFILIRPRKPDEQMVVLETQRRSIRVVGTRTIPNRSLYQMNFASRTALDIVEIHGETLIPVCGQAMPEDYPLPVVRKLSRQEVQTKLYTISYNLRQRGYEPAEARKEALKIIQERYDYEYKPTSDLSLDECRLIGFWLGDGTRAGGRFSMAQSTVYPNIISWVDQVLAKCNYHFTRTDRSDRKNPHIFWQLATGTGFGQMKRNGLLPILPYITKQGTELWKNFTVEQFEAFLEGFWYADGDHGQADNVPETKRISNSNKSLLDLVQWLAVCRGFNSSISEHHRPRKANHSQLYSINISRFQTHAMRHNSMQRESLPFHEESVWCVVNRTGHLVTRRNGKVAVL